MQELDPTFIFVVESQLQGKELKALEDYDSINNEREAKRGGGILVAYKKEIKNMILKLETTERDYEGIWFELRNKSATVRIAVVYFPQENTPKYKLEKAYSSLKKDIEKNRINGCEVIIIGDFNAKLGRKDNEEAMSPAGKLMEKMVKESNLHVINHQVETKGRWTRVEDKKKSEIDYVLCTDPEITSDLVIDEEKLFSAYHVKKSKNKTRMIFSDHNALFGRITWNALLKVEQSKRYRYVMTESAYKEFNDRMQEMRPDLKINAENEVETEYNKFTHKVIDMFEQCKKKVKNKKNWKVDRILIQQIKSVKKELRVRQSNTSTVEVLKSRLQLLKEHITENLKIKNQKEVQHVVSNIAATGKSDLSYFWEFRKRKNIKQEHRTAITDQLGHRHEDETTIKSVFTQYYSQLLKTPKASCPEEQQAELAVAQGMRSLENIWKIPIETEMDEVREAVQKACKELKKKKSGDLLGWKNELIINGGDTIQNGITTLFCMVKQQKCIPTAWLQTKIKSIPKDNSIKIDKRRGLFLPNTIYKVMERTLKLLNEENLKPCSPFQSGGIKGKSTIDNLFTLLTLIQYFLYLKLPIYCVCIDFEKCFDKLWLEDSILELWKSGMKSEDLQILWQMNKCSKVCIDTPVGLTDEITLGPTVKQGTIFGPIMCNRETDNINHTGKKTVSPYGPTIELESLVYFDDICNGGNHETSEGFVEKCSLFEKQRKATVNLDKSGYVVIGETRSNLQEPLQTELKRGKLSRKPQMLYVGTWINEKGSYEINIQMSKGTIEMLINKVTAMTLESDIGVFSTMMKLELYEKVICTSLHDNIAAWPSFSLEEIRKLEKRQGQILRRLLRLPKSTSYHGILYETGIWPVTDKIVYKKLMLLHNIVKSSKDRLIKLIVMQQEKYNMQGSWFQVLTKEAANYGIVTRTSEVEKTSKSSFKKHIKHAIEQTLVRRIVNQQTSKMRSVTLNEWGRKPYLEGQLSNEQVRNIMIIKLHMFPLHDNYKTGKMCDFCNHHSETTEHIIFECMELNEFRETNMPSSLGTCDTDNILKINKFMTRIQALKYNTV